MNLTTSGLQGTGTLQNIIGSNVLVSAFSGTIPPRTTVSVASYTLPALEIGAQSSIYLWNDWDGAASFYLPSGGRYSYVWRASPSEGTTYHHIGGFGEYDFDTMSYHYVNCRSGGSLIYGSDGSISVTILGIVYKRVA